MRFFNKLKGNKLLLLLIALVILILITLGTILYLDKGFNVINLLSNIKPSNSQNSLSSYNELKKEITSLIKKDKKIPTYPDYQKFIKEVNKLENSKLSKEEQFSISVSAAQYLAFAYTANANHNLYDLQQTLKDFIRENFPEKNYPSSKPACFDPVCANNPQPKEIVNVITEIKNSSIPDYLKENDINNLTMTGYVNNEDSMLKTNNYLEIAEMINNSDLYKKAGINLKIYNEINAFVKNSYPKEYQDFQNNRIK